MTRLYFIVMLILIGHAANAQSIQEGPFEFKIVKITHRSSNESNAGAGSMIFSTNTIKWIQKPNAREYEFAVTSAEGIWTEEGDALQSYQVQIQGKSGTIILRRSSTIVTVEFLFQDGNTVIFPYKFLLSADPQ